MRRESFFALPAFERRADRFPFVLSSLTIAMYVSFFQLDCLSWMEDLRLSSTAGQRTRRDNKPALENHVLAGATL